MIASYLTEFFNVLFGNFLPNVQNNAVGLLSSLIAYIPLHFIIKWLLGKENAKLSLFMYMVTMVATITGIFVGG